MKSSSIFATIAVVAASATLPMVASAATQIVTNTVDGIKWQLLINTANHTASVGPNTSSSTAGYWANTGNDWEHDRAMSQSITGTVVIPATFTVDDEEYKVTSIGNRAFIRCKPTTMVLPGGVGDLWNCSFYGCPNLQNVWFKGPATAAEGESQERVGLNFKSNNAFSETKTVKFVLVGPNLTKANANFIFSNCTNITVLLPRTAGNTTWNNTNVGGGTPTHVYYNGFRDHDTSVFFEVSTFEALTNTVNYAVKLKSAFGLNTTISVTDAVEGTLTDLTFDTLWHIAFSVDSQAQLDNVLSAVQVSCPIVIDPADLAPKDAFTIPAGRKVVVKPPFGSEFKSGSGRLIMDRKAE